MTPCSRTRYTAAGSQRICLSRECGGRKVFGRRRRIRKGELCMRPAQVRVYGNAAVETGRSTMNGQDKGRTVPRDTRFTRVWVKQQGRWRLVANHYSSQS